MEKYWSYRLHTSCKKEHNELRKLATSRTYIRRLPRCLVESMCVDSDPGPTSRVVRLRSLPMGHEDKVDDFCRTCDFKSLLYLAKRYPYMASELRFPVVENACSYGNCDIIKALVITMKRRCPLDGRYLAFHYMHWDLLDLILPREPTTSIRECVCNSLPALSYYVNKFGCLPFESVRICKLISGHCYCYGIDRELLDFANSLLPPAIENRDPEMPWLEIPWIEQIPTTFTKPQEVLEVLDYIIAHSPPGYWRGLSINWALTNVPKGPHRDILEARLTLEGCQP